MSRNCNRKVTSQTQQNIHCLKNIPSAATHSESKFWVQSSPSSNFKDSMKTTPEMLYWQASLKSFSQVLDEASKTTCLYCTYRSITELTNSNEHYANTLTPSMQHHFINWHVAENDYISFNVGCNDYWINLSELPELNWKNIILAAANVGSFSCCWSNLDVISLCKTLCKDLCSWIHLNYYSLIKNIVTHKKCVRTTTAVWKLLISVAR